MHGDGCSRGWMHRLPIPRSCYSRTRIRRRLRYATCFLAFRICSPRSCLLASSSTIDHLIEVLDGSTPPSRKIYRMAQCEELELKKQLDDCPESGFIRLSQSPYGAGVLFTKKKGDSLRLCIDYRGFNNIAVKDAYPCLELMKLWTTCPGVLSFRNSSCAQVITRYDS